MTDPRNVTLVESYDGEGKGYTLDKTPFSGNALKSYYDGYTSLTKDIDKGDVQAVGHDVTSTASDVAGFASEATSAASDPLNYLISQGLSFLESWFTPLKEALELVTGDFEEVKAAAKSFDKVAADLNRLAADVARSAQPGGDAWSGAAAPEAGKHVGLTKASLEESSECAGHLASLLQISGMLMKAAYDIINGIIADVVEWFVITWLAALATEVVTFGGSTAAAAAASEGEVAVGVGRTTQKVNKVREVIQKIIRVIRKIMKVFKESKIGRTLAEKSEKTLGRTITDSAVKQVTSQVDAKGLTSHVGDVYDAAEYRADPGHAGGYGQENVPGTEQYMIKHHGFPAHDLDEETNEGTAPA